ncbi:inositol 1,4,5-trisphosphate receptor-interacting protein [Amphiprion ocellaris]|uniref:Inositol 1,4,5-trisphosphate receptor-interacting protein n=1 Tax=Amphiprion ocellaris TaxID=80972 RepID=A0A3Q1D779_AMPOC|nr:inositol 1,4,5-trisphosphate receptor-interacting protein [Amphiprion ocellaris]
MQETVLRVFVVALGLLMCPKDDPGVEDWETSITEGIHEQRLLREEEKLDQEMAPVSEEMTHSGSKGPQDDMKDLPEEENCSDQHVTKKEKMSDVTVTNRDSEDNHKLPEGHTITKSDPSLPQTCNGEPETVPTTSQTSLEQKDRDAQTEVPDRPQGQNKKPEDDEMFGSTEQEAPLSYVYTKTSENETSENTFAEWARDYLWYIWQTFSIISIIRFFRKYQSRKSQMEQEVTAALSGTCTVAKVLLPDVNTLKQFYAKCVQVSSEKKWREDEFLEGFANDLLEAMRTIADKNGSMVIEDFEMVNLSDIIVPFHPPEPYSFQCRLWNNQTTDPLSDMHVCGQIKLLENKKVQNGCPCQSSDADEDMVCLLHCESENVKTQKTDACDGLLCSKNTPFLSKSQVARWFQGTIKQAWALISHKYEFELNIRYIDAPGALVIRFRSGKKISFSMNPVVRFNNDAYFFITPWSSNDLDTFWTLSLTSYEDHLLQQLSKHLPENSCHIQTLEIARFLHKRQTALSGSSALKDHHFKTALMHLLLTKDSSQWKPSCVDRRLRDLLAFMERSLERKLLNHILIGNPLTEVIELPAEFIKAKPVNLFHPLVVHNCIYRHAVMHFQEMLINAHMLIHDYAVRCTQSANSFI